MNNPQNLLADSLPTVISRLSLLSRKQLHSTRVVNTPLLLVPESTLGLRCE
jgi:hypothetical protein